MERRERLKRIAAIVIRLATLEEDRERARLSGAETKQIDIEMTALREALSLAMNDVCPVIKENKCHS